MSNSKTTTKPTYLAAIECGGTSFLLSIGLLIHNVSPSPLLSPSPIPPPVDDNDDDNDNDNDDDETNTNNKNDIIKLTSSKYIQIKHKIRITTTTPFETTQKCSQWLKSHRPIDYSTGKQVISYDGIGIASFGPLGVSKSKNDYGCILSSTPKALWRGVDILSPMLKACTGDGEGGQVPPHVIDTDVNAPAWAEFIYGNNNESSSSSSLSSLCYVTIGTGVGVGLVINSKPVHGRMHPEGGHVCVSPLPNDTFMGYSWGKDKAPYHGKHTTEGIASSVALLERLMNDRDDGTTSSNSKKTTYPSSSSSINENRDLLINIPDNNEIWDHAANAIANLCVSVILLTSIESIVLGGGIMKRKILYDKIRHRVIEIINAYLDLPTVEDNGMNCFIREPTWDDAGLVGAFVLAETAYTTILETSSCGPNVQDNNGKNKDTFWKGFFAGACVALPLFFIFSVRRK